MDTHFEEPTTAQTNISQNAIRARDALAGAATLLAMQADYIEGWQVPGLADADRARLLPALHLIARRIDSAMSETAAPGWPAVPGGQTPRAAAGDFGDRMVGIADLVNSITIGGMALPEGMWRAFVEINEEIAKHAEPMGNGW